MYWHIDTDVVSMIVMSAIYIYYSRLPGKSEDILSNRRFSRCLITGIFVTAVDIAASLVMELPVSGEIYHALMTLYFVSIELPLVEWFLYVLTILYKKGESGGRAIKHAVLSVYVLYAIFAGLNPFTGAIYNLGLNNEYNRGPFFATMIVLYLLYTIAMLLLITVRRRHIPSGYPWEVLLATPFIIAAGIVAQLACPGLLLILPAYMICIVFSFLFLQNRQIKSNRRIFDDISRVAETDIMTGLYNRVGMMAVVNKAIEEGYGQSALVLIADIDDLKSVNDTLGHAGGDRAICLAAAQLKRHFRSRDTIVRYGGDEFLVIITGYFTEEQLRPSVEELVCELREIRITQDVRLHCSIGAAFGIVGEDSFEELCIRADTALYHVKRGGKNAYAFYHPDMDEKKTFAKKDIEVSRNVTD